MLNSQILAEANERYELENHSNGHDDRDKRRADATNPPEAEIPIGRSLTVRFRLAIHILNITIAGLSCKTTVVLILVDGEDAAACVALLSSLHVASSSLSLPIADEEIASY